MPSRCVVGCLAGVQQEPRRCLGCAWQVPRMCLAGAWEEPNRRSWPILGPIFKHLEAKRSGSGRAVTSVVGGVELQSECLHDFGGHEGRDVALEAGHFFN